MADDAGRMADTPRPPADQRPDQAFGGEQRHLGVVSEPGGVTKVRHAVGPECFPDLGPALEFDRGAEGIADSSGQQTARDPLP